MLSVSSQERLLAQQQQCNYSSGFCFKAQETLWDLTEQSVYTFSLPTLTSKYYAKLKHD